MTKSFNAKQFIKQYPKELHPIAEEKMKCCNIISAEWLRKLEKSLKSPFSHIPKNFGKSIEDLVDSDGKLLHNAQRGIDYELVTNFMFDNLSCITDKDNAEVPRIIRCGLGHDPMTGEEVVIFDLVAFNIKMIKCNKICNSSSMNLSKTKSNNCFAGERWYASASWTFQDFLRQYCEVLNIDENTHGFYQDLTLETPIKLNLSISKYFKGSMGKITAHDLYFGATKHININRSMNTMMSNRARVNLENEKSLPNSSNKINESSPFPSKGATMKKHFSKATLDSSSSAAIKLQSTEEFSKSNKKVTTDNSNSSSASSIDSQEESKNNSPNIHHTRDNSAVFHYRFSPSNDLIVPKLSPAGFVNTPNSSYMNSVLQCFIRIPPISSLYFGDKYAPLINTTSIINSQGNISNEFHQMLNDIASTKYDQQNPYDLTKFRTVFTNQYNTFNSNDQKNAYEFLVCLIDGLHEDINQAFSSMQSRKKVLETFSPYESPWEVSQKLNRSLVYDIFLGMTETKFTCQVCSHVNMIKQPFVVLSLPIPPPGIHSAHLEDCLQKYCSKEILTKSNKVECKKCQKRTNHKKILRIERCGQILIIHLMRFESCRKGASCSLKKNDINIIYPKILDMNSYSSKKVGKYRLIGCVFHYGSLESGRYAAASFDQLNDKWYTFDEASVDSTREKNVYNSNAYILFYQKE